MRGIGVAVMCSTCGASPAGALRSSARRWLTPKRCCSSTTATASRSKATACSISACVPTSRRSAPEASLPRRSARRPPGVEPVRSADDTSASGMSAWRVAKCCSASVSVGAISAAWPPCSTARSIAYSATTVLPDPTSPISSRCIGRPAVRSASTAAIGAALVVRRLERQRVGQPPRGQLAGRRQRLGPRGVAPARPPPQQRELEQQQLLEREPAAAALVVAEVRGVRAPPRGRAARGRRAAAPAAARRRRPARRGARARAPRSGWRRCPSVAGYVATSPVAPVCSAVGACGLHAEAVPRLVLAVEHQARARPVLALEPRLVEERRLHRTARVGDDRLDERPHPAPAHGPGGDRAHLDDDRGRLARDELRHRARLRAVARQVLEQVADGERARAAPRPSPRAPA